MLKGLIFDDQGVKDGYEIQQAELPRATWSRPNPGDITIFHIFFKNSGHGSRN